MEIAAAYPRWPWSDLVSALIPNGRFKDRQVAGPEQSLHPYGVPIASFLNGLYLTGVINGYYCGGAPASSPAPTPKRTSTQDNACHRRRAAGRGRRRRAEDLPPPRAYGLPRHTGAAADRERLDRRTVPARAGAAGLLPGAQAARSPPARRSRPQPRLQQAGLNHSSTTRPRVLRRHLRGEEAAARHPGGHRLHPDLSGQRARRRPLHRGPATRQLHLPGTQLRLAGDPARHRERRPVHERPFDPIGDDDACMDRPRVRTAGTATYSHRTSRVHAARAADGHGTMQALDNFGELNSLLFDVAPDGSEAWSRGAYRLTPTQCGPDHLSAAWQRLRLPPGRTAKLELLGATPPTCAPATTSPSTSSSPT